MDLNTGFVFSTNFEAVKPINPEITLIYEFNCMCMAHLVDKESFPKVAQISIGRRKGILEIGVFQIDFIRFLQLGDSFNIPVQIFGNTGFLKKKQVSDKGLQKNNDMVSGILIMYWGSKLLLIE